MLLMFKKIFKRKREDIAIPNKKSYFGGLNACSPYNNVYNEAFFGFIRQSLNFYSTVSPFSHCIDKISTAVSEINLKAMNEEVVDIDLQKLLDNPNPTQTQSDFMRSVSSFLSITGNAFINITGDIKGEPDEMWVIPPQYITIGVQTQTNVYGYPNMYQMTFDNGSIIEFKATEVYQKQTKTTVIRYYNDRYGELWHIKSFNPRTFSSDIFGMSKALPLMLELEQYYSGNLNNKSVLLNGMRSGLAMVNNSQEPWDEGQYESLKEAVENFSGALNAGKVPLLDGVDIKELKNSNKDMQFQELQEFHLERIYNAYNVPLALITSSVMTQNNLVTSQLQFYDNAVLPLLNNIIKDLDRMLLYRYDARLNISYCKAEIPALESRTLENAQALSDLNVVTKNEMRSLLGFKPLTSGGDDIRESATNVVVASTESITIDNSIDNSKEYFYNNMRKQLKEDGSRKFSENQIDIRWKNVVR